MAKKGAVKPAPPAPAQPPEIFAATRVASGAVVKGAKITQAQAEAIRKAGGDIVVCGTSLTANRQLAGQIERNANGSAKRCRPHKNAGPRALPHYQTDPRPPAGHTFYETPNRKAR